MISNILIAIITISPFVVSGQELINPETNLGINMGGNISRVNFDPSVDQDLNFGFQGGITFKYVNIKNLGIQLEANYLQVGWKESLDSTNLYLRNLNYLQIPFMTHIQIGEGRIRFHMNLGSFVSFLISDRERINLLPGVQEQSYYRLGNWNRAEYGFCLGVGLLTNTSIGIFQIEGRINYTLTNVFKKPPDSPFTVSQNQSFAVTLSYLLDL